MRADIGRNWRNSFDPSAWAGKGGFFGDNGPFGEQGPFGDDGPFGSNGFFGDGRKWAASKRRGRFTRDELRLILLALIADEPRHGYDLIRLLEERSGGQYAPSPGVIYPALSLLADEGLIEEQASDDKRRRYAISEDGRAALEAQAEMVGEVLGRLTTLGERAERNRPPQIERAAANLFMAVGQRLGSGGGEGDLPHEIAAILDEAAQRIERL